MLEPMGGAGGSYFDLGYRPIHVGVTIVWEKRCKSYALAVSS